MIGRIGLAISAANPDRVYVLAEAEGDLRGLYRSEDRGDTFRQISDDRNMLARPWYYTHVDAHPHDADVVYINNESFFRSDDGGETLVQIPTPHGDNHDMWFNPDNPEIFIQSNDGGANVTFNGGETWSTQYNQPTAEFYTVTADNDFPYRLYAPQQDNTTISVPSRMTRGAHPLRGLVPGPGVRDRSHYGGSAELGHPLRRVQGLDDPAGPEHEPAPPDLAVAPGAPRAAQRGAQVPGAVGVPAPLLAP